MKTVAQAITALQALKRNVKRIAANEMVNYALDNIRMGKDIRGRNFTPRKPNAKRNMGRAILVDRGRGRASLQGKETAVGAELTGLDYMIAHNEGVNKTVTARSRKGKVYSKKMNLPQRQFSGDSPAQRERIETIIGKSIVAACT